MARFERSAAVDFHVGGYGGRGDSCEDKQGCRNSVFSMAVRLAGNAPPCATPFFAASLAATVFGENERAATTASAGVTGAFVIVTCLFFAWGFITSLNDPLVAAVKGIFTLSRRSKRNSSPSPSSSPTA